MGKGIMFMVFVWLMVSIGGGVVQGSNSISATALTVALSDTGTTVTVTSTEGFPNTGFIEISDERIGYASKTSTTFRGNFASPLVRGANDTTAVAHSVGEIVRTIEGSMLNQSLDYKLAVLSDASGLLAFVTIPFALLSLIITFFTLPLGFLGTDLQILTYLWAVISIGILMSVGIALVGGRRV